MVSPSPAPSAPGCASNADGSVDQHIGSTYTPINASTDWVRPTSAASGNYQIRARKTSGSNPTAAYSDALNTWLSLNVARAWAVARSGNGETTSVLSIEIRFSGGTTLATGIYTLVATRESYDY